MKTRQRDGKIFKYRQTIRHEPNYGEQFFSVVHGSRASQQRPIDASSDFVQNIVRNNSHSLGKYRAKREAGK